MFSLKTAFWTRVLAACGLLAGGVYGWDAASRGAEKTSGDKSTVTVEEVEKTLAKKAADTDGQTYNIPVIDHESFEAVYRKESAAKDALMESQRTLLESRYDLSDNPADVMMSGGRKAVQQGVRVKLPEGVSWESLAAMTPAEIKEQGLFPMGFRSLPHADQYPGGMVFPQTQIDAIKKAEGRNLERFDIAFDIPTHFTPEFPPPIFLSQHPALGDVSQGKVLTIKNYYKIMRGLLTPVQMEGLRVLLMPFPQQQFNQTTNRKTKEQEMGVSCLDCHTNGHTNAAFHLNPDTRPQKNRFRIDTVSLRGMFNQQIHGSKRSLRSVEDFTHFEQRTAYFDGDLATAQKKGVHFPDRMSQVAMMAQMQNMFDFPPTPKLDVFGELIPEKATEAELRGEKLFYGKARCAECHPAPFFLDNRMHDLRLGRFYEPKLIRGHYDAPVGPIKTFTLRGIKDSPPYLHDGRLLTLADTVEFFNLVLQTDLTKQEKADLVAYLMCL